LQAQTKRDFETIVVDNASTDGGAVGLPKTYPGLRLRLRRLDSNRGFALANNVGARLARGRWLALLNPDAFPRPAWIEQLLQAAGAHPDSFFASRQIQADRPRLLDGEGDVYYAGGLSLRGGYNSPVPEAGPPREVFSACAAAALYPRQAFLDSGGFDEDYFAYHEDVDLGFRLRLRGLRCFVVPRAVVDHVGQAGSRARRDFATYHGHRNLVWTYVKDMPSPQVWLFLPLHLFYNLVSILYFFIRGQGAAILRAKIDALRGLPAAISKRRIVQAGRHVAPEDILALMNRSLLGPFEGWMSRQWPRAH
jgi:GT2 family glycosyltransferase